MHTSDLFPNLGIKEVDDLMAAKKRAYEAWDTAGRTRFG
jgi:hypothetical protein